MAEIRRLAFPIEFDSRTGHLRTAVQDSVDDVAGCTEVVLRTRIGDRLELPDFGTLGLLFKQLPVDLDTLVEHLSRCEPRARLLAQQDTSRFSELAARVGLKISTGG